MPTEDHDEISVNGLVIFDLNDLPAVTVEGDKITAGETTISRAARLTFEELRQRSQELYSIALKIREMETSPQLALAISVIEEQTNHTGEEARNIAMAMLQNGVTLYG